jgi:hypothetical protein
MCPQSSHRFSAIPPSHLRCPPGTPPRRSFDTEELSACKGLRTPELHPGGGQVARLRGSMGPSRREERNKGTTSALILGICAAGKRVGAMCVAPVVVATVLGRAHSRLTVGTGLGTARAIETMGARHCASGVADVIIEWPLALGLLGCSGTPLGEPARVRSARGGPKLRPDLLNAETVTYALLEPWRLPAVDARGPRLCRSVRARMWRTQPTAWHRGTRRSRGADARCDGRRASGGNGRLRRFDVPVRLLHNRGGLREGDVELGVRWRGRLMHGMCRERVMQQRFPNVCRPGRVQRRDLLHRVLRRQWCVPGRSICDHVRNRRPELPELHGGRLHVM